ncbi:MAG: hypothetical protein EOO59_02790 [Hymenobacter sp.]|nr:MAG: hypothetical protein EOO59_02790 [Hymenobacter sp.]
MQPQPPPKGSLEELFRHHLLESEAAAMPPRPLVWEHLDNSLLLAQNEKYRRRLLAYRWGMAASLLLATLAGGGWWHSQQAATATLARTPAPREAARRAVAGAVAATSPAVTTAQPATLASAQRPAESAAVGAASRAAPLPTGQEALAYSGPANSRLAAVGFAAGTLAQRGQAKPSARAQAYATAGHPNQLAGGTYPMAGASPAHQLASSSPNGHAIAATATSSFVELPGAALPVDHAAERAGEALAAAATPPELAAGRLGEALLATRFAALAVGPATGLPAELAPKELPPPSPTLLRRWRYGAEYAISAFQPNIDFNRNPTDYSSALGLNTVSLTRAAAAEYRANLRSGLGQRLTLRATRWLGGHWSLSTGLEVTQQEAHSATSAAFTGEQLPDVSTASFNPGATSSSLYVSRDLHESSFRYRSAGVPLELRYDNQAKPGLSFYGRLGAIVTALLSVRSEVAGNSEATRTYSLTSASTPYRRLTALLRGSAGVRYRPAGRTWGLNVGPTAEAGVQSLNAETDRSFLQQRRPYSVGIEAGIEFGGGLKLAQ